MLIFGKNWCIDLECGFIVLPVIIQDGIESVGYGDDSAAFELIPDSVLYVVIRLQIHGRRGLVQNQDLRLP